MNDDLLERCRKKARAMGCEPVWLEFCTPRAVDYVVFRNTIDWKAHMWVDQDRGRFNKLLMDLFDRMQHGEAKRAEEKFSWRYNRYLRSQAWYEKRKAVIRRAKNQCEMPDCRRRTPFLDVHHLTYENFEHEPLSDLVALCRQCHERVEFEKEQARSGSPTQEQEDVSSGDSDNPSGPSPKGQ